MKLDRETQCDGRADEIGYRPAWTGEHVTQENAHIVPVNRERQKAFEKALMELSPE